MYGDVWHWAGKFRKTDKNIGVDWIDSGSYSEDEIAIRFKYRLVSIHCFPNGNGRHSRLMADIIAEKLLGKEVFSWRGNSFSAEEKERVLYLNAIRQADQGDIDALLIFSRS